MSALAVDPVLMSATIAAFGTPYQDKHMVVRNLLGKMKSCRDRWCDADPTRRLYSPCIPVVQASMMGKTRMFFALPTVRVFVFYCCLRKEKSSGYPKSIPSLTEALTGSCTEGFYCAFLLAALDALHTFKQSFEKNDTVFSAWFVEQQRPDFWTKIIGLFLFISFWSSLYISRSDRFETFLDSPFLYRTCTWGCVEETVLVRVNCRNGSRTRICTLFYRAQRGILRATDCNISNNRQHCFRL